MARILAWHSLSLFPLLLQSLPHHTGESIDRNSKRAWHHSNLLANTNFKLTAAVVTVFLLFSRINEKDLKRAGRSEKIVLAQVKSFLLHTFIPKFNSNALTERLTQLVLGSGRFCGRFKTWFNGHVVKPMRNLATSLQCAYLKKGGSAQISFLFLLPAEEWPRGGLWAP